MIRPLSLVLLGGALAACSRSPQENSQAAAPSVALAPAASVIVTTTAPAAGGATVGQPAPEFSLMDLDGKAHRLADYRGKVVVLEWFNPGCPFVNMSHTKGSLKTLAEEKTKDGVVWLAINSAAEGKQGFGKEANLDGKKRFGLSHPILLDETGQVGHAYGAEHTPHLFIVDEKGTLVYKGAIDNSPDGEGESPTDGKLVNYVDETLSDLKAGRPVRTPSTKAYGCGVKYGA
jgi:peroxiredoxin